jgi:hypothetical protein
MYLQEFVMKAFAEYFEENGIYYRKNTLLQFGDSWDLIGNVVLANPGSAEPVQKPDRFELGNIESFFSNYRNKFPFVNEHWFEFKTDPTMLFIEKIFNGFYIGEHCELNGVIQLFNTFNLKDQNLENALSSVDVKSEHTFSNGIESLFHNRPTYFGFSNAVLNHGELSKVAQSIFENSSDTVKQIYNSDFRQNKFYHPMYINRSYKQKHFQNYKDTVLSKIYREL